MRITESKLRTIIRQEVRRLSEVGGYDQFLDREIERHMGGEDPEMVDGSAFIIIGGNDWDNEVGDEEYEELNAMLDKVFANVSGLAQREGLMVDGGHEAGWRVEGPGAEDFARGMVNQLSAGRGAAWAGVTGDPALVSMVKGMLKYADVLESDENPDHYAPRAHNVY